ncbi:MAG: hypothetical protein V3W41_22170 [Planctomycetota bacterium]
MRARCATLVASEQDDVDTIVEVRLERDAARAEEQRMRAAGVPCEQHGDAVWCPTCTEKSWHRQALRHQATIARVEATVGKIKSASDITMPIDSAWNQGLLAGMGRAAQDMAAALGTTVTRICEDNTGLLAALVRVEAVRDRWRDGLADESTCARELTEALEGE